MQTSEQFDLVVVGGGPGGSTLSTLVAQQGHKVLLLEKEKFPRYQIGESLLPNTVSGMAKLLGIKDELDAAGFPKKGGGTFRWGSGAEPWSFAFSTLPELGQADGYAYQVERAKFDDILLQNAKRKGVIVREECTVHEPIEENGRFVGVKYTDSTGAQRVAHGRYIADASGNTGGLHQYAGERIFSKFFQNIALFGYFLNGKRLPPPRSGNILCAAFKRGWFWYIPLSDTLTSVGAVVAKQEADMIKQGHEEALQQFISECPLIQEHLASATRVTEGMYGKLRIRKDYSYQNTSFWKPGLVLVGDAACFIDPVLSTGVHLATYSGLLAARSINTCLARGEGEGPSEEACFDEFERRYRREFGLFYQYLTAFYNMHHDADSYFWMARSVLDTEERANEAFVRLVAGVASDEFFRASHHLSKDMQRDPVNPDPAAKTHFDEIFKGRLHVEKLGLPDTGDSADEAEAPWFQDGLVSSADGLHWRTNPTASTQAAPA